MLTLDIQDGCLRLMTFKGKQALQALTIPLEPGLVRDGIIEDVPTVSQRLKAAVAQLGGESDVMVSTSNPHLVYRVVVVPVLPRAMLAEAAQREMERHMPVALEELHTAWKAVPISSTEMVLCLAGMPRNTVSSVRDLLHQAGLAIKALELRPLVLARLCSVPDAVVINALNEVVDIAIVLDGIPQLARTVAYPAADMSPADKAWWVREEVERTINFYSSSQKERQLPSQLPAFVSGDVPEVAEALELPVKPLLHPFTTGTGLAFTPETYAANLGLALRDTKGAASRLALNLLEVYRPGPSPLLSVIAWAVIFAGIIALGWLGSKAIAELRETEELRSRVELAQVELSARQGSEKAIKELQTRLSETKATLQRLKQPMAAAAAQRARVNDNLKAVTRLLPATVKLSSISYGGSLEIKGIASDKDTVLAYTRTLRDNAGFSEVTIRELRELSYNRWQFVLSLR